MGEGATLAEALEAGLSDLDGFYTFTMGTRDGFAVLRDGIACKPAVLAETDDWVAMASEFRSLANLPGVDKATIWGPKPAVVYTWSLQQPGMITDGLADTSVRALKDRLHKLHADTNERAWHVINPKGAHALACGLTVPIEVVIDGHAGYYCAGMNKEASVIVNGHAGQGVAENIMSGQVRVKGNA